MKISPQGMLVCTHSVAKGSGRGTGSAREAQAKKGAADGRGLNAGKEWHRLGSED